MGFSDLQVHVVKGWSRRNVAAFRFLDVAVSFLTPGYIPSLIPSLPRSGTEQLYVVYRGLEPVGATVLHKPINIGRAATSYFSNLRLRKDRYATQLLFESLVEDAERLGASLIKGPMGPSMTVPRGISTRIVADPTYGMPQNPEYYSGLLGATILEPAETLRLFVFRRGAKFEPVKKIAALSARKYPHIQVRQLDLSDPEKELGILVQVYNQAGAGQPGFVALDAADFMRENAALVKSLGEEFGAVAFDGDKPIGFELATPDFNQALARVKFAPKLIRWKYVQRRLPLITNIRGAFISVIKEARNQGVETRLFNQVLTALGNDKRDLQVRAGWVADHNSRWMNELAFLDQEGLLRTEEFHLFQVQLSYLPNMAAIEGTHR